jgi:hypothetical protein
MFCTASNVGFPDQGRFIISLIDLANHQQVCNIFCNIGAQK